jgi:hypothetical protein
MQISLKEKEKCGFFLKIMPRKKTTPFSSHKQKSMCSNISERL